jgi:hypothetical protein
VQNHYTNIFIAPGVPHIQFPTDVPYSFPFITFSMTTS